MRRRAAALALAVTLLLGGCGIPDNSDVTRIGPGPSTSTTGGDATPTARQGRTATLDPATFVKNYLQAAAGDLEGAAGRAKDFMTAGAAEQFKPPDPIEVVRLVGGEPLVLRSGVVKLVVQPIGSLDGTGVLTRADDTARKEYQFTVVERNTGLFLSKVPPVLMISDTDMESFYKPVTIYFWNIDGTGLVPDQRWLPQSVQNELAPTEILRWLTTGPQQWLKTVVVPLPTGTKPVGNVPAVNNDTLRIDLSAEALPPDNRAALENLRVQLSWSLRPYLPGTLELRVGNQVSGKWSDDSYLTRNPSYRIESRPERFVLFNRRVSRLIGSVDQAADVPVLGPDDNRNIEWAAMSASADRTYAGVVTGTGAGRVLKVAVAPRGQQAELRPVAMPPPAGPPAWAVTPSSTAETVVGLVAGSDGRLWSFTSAGGSARRLTWPNAIGAVTAVAVAPDARRVALVAGGKLYLTVLSGSGDNVELEQPTVVATPMSKVTAVDWSSEGWLVLGGTRIANGRVGIVDLTVDGSQQNVRLGDVGADPVTHLAAFPAGPLAPTQTADAVVYVAGDQAFNAFLKGQRIGVADLSPAVPEPPPGAIATNPFFLR